MGGQNNSAAIYQPLISEMTWSYSRLQCYNECPYRFFMKYIKGCQEHQNFYSSYGSFMHKLLEQYYRGKISKEEMQIRVLIDFQSAVEGARPPGDIVSKYIKSGTEYLQSFKPLPFKMIDVEKEVHFSLNNKQFVGFIDYIGEKDGELYIVDNKSRDLKPRSNKTNPTLKDNELDEMLRQLYVYSLAIKQEYGVFPKALCFNCFRTGVFIEEPFCKNTYNDTIKWATGLINDIETAEEFPPNREFFMCSFLCGLNDDCIFWEMR